jgi:hypothetical protein
MHERYDISIQIFRLKERYHLQELGASEMLLK